ncbi:hypothetical protein EZS27_018106 [termite gut metagenome]|uniref:DNA primase n=1 Tax=termite gut metagenome TaxID=433724 RepID=A0A5J4RK07_9ZZZZ
MKEYRFALQAYKGVGTRYTCPQCGRHRTFVRYTDRENNTHFPEYVGRCNREDTCGYHYTPKQYFSEHPETKKSAGTWIKPALVIAKPISFIDATLVIKSLNKFEDNYLFVFLCHLFDRQTVWDLMQRYRVGTANHWKGATVFWQTGMQGRARTGKIMLYNPDTGRRVKFPHNHITWVHSLLKYEDFNLKQCFFGMHLLGDKSKPVAIVESEKTAMIASIYVPEYIWIATSGKNGCLMSESYILRDRKVVLFPDINAFEDWKMKAKQLKAKDIQVELFSYLEAHATDEQRRNGYDIADFLIRSKPKESVLDAMLKKNPHLALLIEKFNLTEV